MGSSHLSPTGLCNSDGTQYGAHTNLGRTRGVNGVPSAQLQTHSGAIRRNAISQFCLCPLIDNQRVDHNCATHP